MHSIRFKITAISIAAILVTVACVFGVAYSTLHAGNEQTAVEMMNLIGKDTENSIEKYTESIEQSMEMIANYASDSLDRVILAENGAAGENASKAGRTREQQKALDDYLEANCNKVRETQASFAGHTHGVITYYYCINPEVSENVHGYFYSRVGKTGYEEQEPLDARELDPADKAHTTWYYTPIERGRPSWVGPYTAHFLNEMWICSYLIPIYKSGTFIGVMGMDIPVETLTEQVSPIRVYDTGFASLLDENGHVLYHPELKFGSEPDLKGLSVDEDLLKQEDSGNELIRYTSESGQKRQMSFCTLSNGMKLVIAAPISEIDASWTKLIRNVLIAALIIIGLFVLLVMMVMGYITRPLAELTAASQRLANEDYDAELNYHAKDEIGKLTEAFDKMRDQMKQYIDDLNRRAVTDTLTDLPNMRGFFQLALSERDRLLDAGKMPVMLYFDLIGMKYYNRQYGFAEGDKLLRDVGKVLARHYGPECMCRFSEDHFAAVSDMESLEEKLQAVFRECESANGGNSVPIRAGVYPHSREDVSVSIACDRAKFACDRNRAIYESGYEIFDHDLHKQLEDVRYIINHLNQALEEQWVHVYYQPIVRAGDGKLCDEEALSRWIDPVRGLLSPADFIPVLERARLIYKLDLYVLDRILEKMQVLKEAGREIVPISLNLSRADFDSCDIVEEICRRMDAAGMPHDRLTIEVTESMVGSDFDFMKKQILRFQASGFEVWMDDFGSGYSSLDVLQDIRFDLLKFDMRFMHRFEEGEESRIILTELIRMAIDLGIDTVCEGVETREQAEFLRKIGCTKLQGYHFGKPEPFETE